MMDIIEIEYIQNIFTIVIIILILLYIAFQKHLLIGSPLGKWIGRIFFYPMLPLTYFMLYINNKKKSYQYKYNAFFTIFDDTLLLGAAPLFNSHIKYLYSHHNVRGVINMCEEYSGPKKIYSELGIVQIHLKTIDHEEPTLESMREAIAFLKHYQNNNKKERVLCHCKAGRGRSGAIGLIWLALQNPNKSLKELNDEMLKIRPVRKTLYKQKNVNEFIRTYKNK